MAESSGDIGRRKIVDSADVDRECVAAEEEIAALRMSYEQYFLGMERRPPTAQHDALKKQIVRLKSSFIRQTALKFRVQSIHNKFLTYERLWVRTLQEIENGTYQRDIFKARLHAQERAAKAKAESKEKAESAQAGLAEAASSLEAALAKAAPGAKAPAAAAAKVAAAPAAKAPAPVAAASAGGLNASLSDQKLRAVYDAYVTAKKRCQEDTSKLSFEQVAANLRKQVPDLVKKAGAQNVEFKIVIKDGKAVLRAVPK
jgi:hypothetical protein